MLDFNYYSPTYYEFGKNKEELVGKMIKERGYKKVLIHYGSGSIMNNGILDKVLNCLSNEGIDFICLGGVKANPESDLVYEGIKLCRDNDIDFILAIGGGSVIDSSKAIAVGTLYNGDFWDFFDNLNRKKVEKSLSVGVVLTISAAGSEGSPSMVITNSKTKEKRGNIKCDLVRPVFAIMNPLFTMSLSDYQTSCGIVDIMTHVIERYFSNTSNCIVTDNMCEAILKSMIECGNLILENPNDYDARANIMWSSTIAHNNICGVGREQDWASHKIEHELSGKYNVAHGAGLSVVVIKWMKYVSKINPSKFERFAKNIFNVDDIDESISKLQKFWISLGMPSNLVELGYNEDDLDYLVNNIDYTKDGYIGNYVKLYKEDVRNIFMIG